MREKEQKDAQVENRERPGSRLVGVLQLTAALYKRRERSSSSFRIVWKGVDDAPQLQQLHWRLQGNPITAQLHCCAAYRGVRVLGNLPAIGIICAVALAGYTATRCSHLRTNFCKSSRFCHMSPPPFLLSENMRMKMIFGQI